MLLTLNNLAKQAILSLLVIGLILPSAALAFVTTTGLPFTATNIFPGSTMSGSIAIENTTGATQMAGLQIFNPTGDFALFANEVTYNVTGDFVATGDMGDLASLLELGDVADNATGNYEFSLTLNTDAPQNPLMGKGFGFDLCVGFVGAEPVCGVAFVPPTPPGGGGGSGGSGTIVHLKISNENASPVGTDFATITWDTNLPATSKVVYGLASAGPYTLNESNLPNLGYPQGTIETGSNVEDHEVDLTSLVPGETYLYRVVSTRGSNTEVSPELSFTLLSGAGLTTPTPQGLVLGDTTSNTDNFFGAGGGAARPDGIVLGVEDDAGSEASGTTPEVDPETASGTVLGASVVNDLVSVLDDETGCWLLLLVVILVIWFVWSFIDDFIVYRGNDISRKLLLNNLVFVAGMGLVLFFLNDFLNWFGLLFLLVVTVLWIIGDHMKHGVRIFDWSPKNRHIYFTVAFALAGATAYFIDHSCLIIPLLVAAAMQIIWAAVEL